MISSSPSPAAQVIVLPRCRKSDGGCGSHRVWASGGTRPLGDGRKVRYYCCKQCGRKFKVLVIDDEG